MQTCYDILGIPRRATGEAIKAAYRRLAKQGHPDRNPHPQASARFREIDEAYRILRDPARRAAYDATLARAEAE